MAVLPWAILLAAACGSESRSQTAESTLPSVEGAQSDPCEVRPGSPTPVSDPSGPYFHQVVAARTGDGVTLRDARQVLEHASVPDGVRRPDGSVRIYYVNGEDGSVWVARMEGDLVTPLGPISLDGIARPAGVVDPDATALADGSIRLAYLGGFGPPESRTERAICLADSSDGQNFTVLGTALRFPAGDPNTDPSLTALADGSWLMAISRGQQTVLARSADGLAFTLGETLSYGGVPEVTSLSGGRVRLYVCAQGIESYVSLDGGTAWRREGTVVSPGAAGRRIVCDPSFVAGTDVFLYKSAN